jgi:hypothetical protein
MSALQSYVTGAPLAAWAHEIARGQLSETLPDRWAHVEGVEALAGEIAPLLGIDGKLLLAAASLHDVGWAPALASSGFPALDGAPFLERLATPPRLVALCVNYSCAAVEARLRGREAEMAGYPDEEGAVRDALWYCDLSVGMDGARMSVDARLADFVVRYGDHPLAGGWIRECDPLLRGAASRTQALISAGTIGAGAPR